MNMAMFSWLQPVRPVYLNYIYEDDLLRSLVKQDFKMDLPQKVNQALEIPLEEEMREEARTPKTGCDWRIFLTLDLDQILGAGQGA